MKAKTLKYNVESSHERILLYANIANYVKKYMTFLSITYSKVKRYKKLFPKITASDPNYCTYLSESLCGS